MITPPEKQTLQARNAAIPQELKSLRQWARWSPKDERKQPLNLDGTPMYWQSKPETRLSFEKVARYPHIETFITLEAGIIGVDFDGCVDKNGEIHPVVKRYIDQAHTYAEQSPSDTGIKMWIRGSIPGNKSFENTKVPWGVPGGHTGIEVYADKRPFTVTGNIIPDCPSEINEAPEVLNDILVHYTEAPKTKRKESPAPTNGTWDFNAWVLRHLEVEEQLVDGFIITCPWASEHTTPGDTARIWEGPPHTFSCFHAHCSGREWPDVRLKYEPTAYDNRDAWSNTTTYSPGQEHSSNGNGHVPPNSDAQSDKEDVTAKVTAAIESKNVEELYRLTNEIILLPPIEQEVITGTVKSGMDKCKAFSVNAFNRFLKEALQAKKAEERAEREALSEYERTDAGMIHNSEIHGPVVLSNFTAEIVADTKVDDGVEQNRFYALQAELYGRNFSFEVPAKDLDKCGWVDQELGARARVSAGNSIKAHLANAIKATSEPEEKDQYAHTGWRKIDGRSVFLHTGECLSQVSQVTIKNNIDLTQITLFDKSALQALLERERERVSQVSQVSQEYIQASVRLTGSLSNYTLSCERSNMQQAISASLSFMDLASDTITVPLYSALWRAVIGNVNFGVHLAGQTGWGKSELCALIQQHFGASMHAKNLPGSWESTVNSLEMLLFQAKDTVVVVDDFKPKGSKADQDRLHANADRVFRQIGNGQGRGRLDSNLGQRAERRPRCLLLSTGEDIPRGQSLKSRGIVLIMSERITAGEASKRLLEAQKDARTGLYAQAMAGYIEWLAPRIEAIQAQLADIVAEEREKLCIDGHARSSDNTANLLLGMKCFLQYAYEIGAITAEEARAYLTRCKNALIRIAEEASREDREEKQSEQWRKLIESALINKSAYLVGPDGEMPGLEYGWEQSIRVIERDGALENEETFRPGGKQIGWIEGDDIYLNPKAAYDVAKALGSSDLVTLESTLRKFLHQDGLLASTDLDKKRPTITVRRRLQKSQKDVLHIKRSTLFPSDPHVDSSDSHDSVDSEPHEAPSEDGPDVSQVDDEKASESSSKVDSEETQIPNEDMRAIPDEYRDILVRYQKKVYSLKSDTPLWTAPDSGYRNTMFGKNEHIMRTKSLLRSGELNKIKAALEAMLRTLGEYQEDRRGA